MKSIIKCILLIQIVANISCKLFDKLSLNNYDVRKLLHKSANSSLSKKHRILHKARMLSLKINKRALLPQNEYSMRGIIKRYLNGNSHKKPSSENSHKKNSTHKKIHVKVISLNKKKHVKLIGKVKNNGKFVTKIPTVHTINVVNAKNPEKLASKINNKSNKKLKVQKNVFSSHDSNMFEDLHKLVYGDSKKKQINQKKIPHVEYLTKKMSTAVKSNKKIKPVIAPVKPVKTVSIKKADNGFSTPKESIDTIDKIHKNLNIKGKKSSIVKKVPKAAKSKLIKIPKTSNKTKKVQEKDKKKVIEKALRQTAVIIPKKNYPMRLQTATNAPSSSATSSTAPTTPFVCPTGNEGLFKRNIAVQPIDIIKQINAIRMNPKGFAETVKKQYIDPVDETGKHCKWGITFHEKKAIGQELYEFLLTKQPEKPIYGNGCLIVTAHEHAQYMADHGQIEHDEMKADGSLFDLLTRIKKWANFNLAAESIGTLMTDHFNAVTLVGHLLLDDGISSRVNRNNILKKGWRTLGVGMVLSGNVKYYDLIYANNYQCVQEASIDIKAKKEAGALEFFGGQKLLTQNVRRLNISNLLSFSVSILLFSLSVLLI